MRYLLILSLLFSSTAFAEETDKDLGEFFKIKTDIKEKIVEVVKSTHQPEITKQLQVKITNNLKNGLNNLILSGDKFLYTLISDFDDIKEKSMFFTILAKYEDEAGDILWEFHVFCTPDNILFFSRLAEPPAVSSDDYYNWLKLERG